MKKTMDRIEDKVFYTVVGFKNKNECATFYKDKYIRMGNAKKVASNLIKSGYERVVIRKEEIFLQDDNNDFSASSVLKVLES